MKDFKQFCRLRKSERGSASLALILFLLVGVLTVATLMASDSLRTNRTAEQDFVKQDEKWKARSDATILAQVVEKDAPSQLSTDVNTARNSCNLDTGLDIFDETTVTSSQPAATLQTDGSITCSNANTPTSIFGTFTDWSDRRINTLEKVGQNKFDLDSDRVKIIEINEVYRRKIGVGADAESTYVARYIVESKSGNYRTRTNGEIILGSDIPGCGTSVIISAVPTTINQGSPTIITVRYRYASNIKIYNRGGTLLDDRNVSEQSNEASHTFSVSPVSDEEYYAVATGSGNCSAQSTNIEITVISATPLCQTITNFTSSASSVTVGGSVVISWEAHNYDRITLNGVDVTALGIPGSRSYTINSDTTFTLIVTSATPGVCPPIQQTLTVTTIPPACTYSAPSISFTATPSRVRLGERITYVWNVTRIESGNTIRLQGSGMDQAIPSSGSGSNLPPQTVGTYTYTITARNTCPDGTVLESTRSVQIVVEACPQPTINTFVASPSTVTQGANGRVILSWSIAGTVDAVSIDNGVGGGLPASGTVDIPQPNSTTNYTITVVGCGVTRTANVAVNVTVCSAPQINSFTATPASVVAGGNATVRFAWNAVNTNGSATVRIEPGIASGLPLSGIYSITQPNVNTTYTLHVDNSCGLSASSNTSVSVTTVNGCTPDSQNRIARFQRSFFGQTSCRRGACSTRPAGVSIDAYLYTDGRFQYTADLYADGIVYNRLGPNRQEALGTGRWFVNMQTAGISFRFDRGMTEPRGEHLSSTQARGLAEIDLVNKGNLTDFRIVAPFVKTYPKIFNTCGAGGVPGSSCDLLDGVKTIDTLNVDPATINFSDTGGAFGFIILPQNTNNTGEDTRVVINNANGPGWTCL